jgi:hypothetical protein
MHLTQHDWQEDKWTTVLPELMQGEYATKEVINGFAINKHAIKIPTF